jgi:hypothetical protein
MNVADELEKLARLQREGVLTEKEFERAKGLVLSGCAYAGRKFRRESTRKLLGWPLWSIAVGPDLEKGELRGHARGIIAIGDMATGGLALGGFARGLIAVGGMAIGLISFGGCAVGVLMAFGGLALGAIAVGGGAVGAIALGGGACGYYAMGGGAVGTHTVDAVNQDPQAVSFFEHCVPFLSRLIHH